MTELVDRSAAVIQRFGGTVDKFTGDGLMAMFGAPVALEDHASRACLAALDIQREAKQLAAEVERRDDIALQVRIGLNSGEVIAGEIGSGALGYTAIGEQVGMAQRMESAAPPCGVLLSESTARLVDHVAALGDPELVSIKGADAPVEARRLLEIGRGHETSARQESSLIGRRWEKDAAEGILERAIDGRGGVVGVVGSAGIGKSRLVREIAAIATGRGADVFTAFCESHTRDIPFHAVSQLLRAGTGVADLDGEAARKHVRLQVSDADLDDLLLFDDMLGIADPDAQLPNITSDARRRRLTALVNATSLARETPAVFVVEDAHWIDEVSESMLADFLPVVPQSSSMTVITYRPDYRGALAQVPGAQTITLVPLSDSETAALIDELLGSDPSLNGLVSTIAERASGNPFFVEEIVRELVQRGALTGERGRYVCATDVAEVMVPATLHATIAARIDRLGAPAKRTLSAAAVIGSRFGTELFGALNIDPVLDVLIDAELVDQVKFTPRAEYAFRHPLIRTVAYESQLTADRADLHRRIAEAIESQDPNSADESAALIAEHLETAGDLRAAYAWHMRAGDWSTDRDIAAAHLSWERARRAAAALPTDDPDRDVMLIGALTLLCGNAWRIYSTESRARFCELRQLSALTGDRISLAIGMAGQVIERTIRADMAEASQLASEHMALLESIGDPAMTVGLSFGSILAKMETARWPEVLGLSQLMIDLADGDPTAGSGVLGSPLAFALTSRAQARWCTGRPGWRDDFDAAVELARERDPMSLAYVHIVKYATSILNGVFRADDFALSEIGEFLEIAEGSADDVILGSARFSMGIALVHSDSARRERGLEFLAQVQDMSLHKRFFMSELPIVDVYAARERARRGDPDAAISVMRCGRGRVGEQGPVRLATTGYGCLG
jgi:adenylate cyclase